LYLWRLAGTRPPDVDGLLVFASCTVAGGIITAVTPAPGVTRAEAWRALGGLGTMATQNAGAVAITGGTAGLTSLGVGAVAPATSNYTQLNGPVGIQTPPVANAVGSLVYNKITQHGMYLGPVGSDSGSFLTMAFGNLASGVVGSIDTTATGTSFNTTSDVRLKHAITPLADALARVRALRPVQFRWNSTDEPDEGFLAHELQQHMPHAVSGEPDAVNDDGSIRPQQVDHSRLVPWLTAALQATMAQLDAAVARITTLEEAQGL
jgi:hypothetical protein